MAVNYTSNDTNNNRKYGWEAYKLTVKVANFITYFIQSSKFMKCNLAATSFVIPSKDKVGKLVPLQEIIL